MKVYELQRPEVPAGWVQTERATPEPGAYEVLIRVKAVSLNYRDVVLAKNPKQSMPRVPVSDGAGEVVALGAGAHRFAVGDRVAVNFFTGWADGAISDAAHASALGGAVDGMLTEFIAVPETALVKLPDYLSYAEAAALPCAAVTVWNALFESAQLKAGETVLLLGTGGVSIFGLQFAKMAGARTIITSSSDAKLARAKAMGADEVINYKTNPDWHQAVWQLTDKRGVDYVVEVGGVGTLEKSLAATRYGGTVCVIGLLSGLQGQIDPYPLLFKSLRAQGVYVGSTAMFARMLAAMQQSQIRPVIDREFSFDQAPEALAHLASGEHFGKLVIHVE